MAAPRAGAGRAAASRAWRRLSRADREALGIWAVAHAALFVLAWASAWELRSGNARGPLAPYQHWDAAWQQNIAAHGYFSAASAPHSAAFFPGFPLALAAVHMVLRNWVVSELVLSGAALAVAMVALTRLAGTSRAALVLAAMPAAVFLTVGYQVSLFLALAIPAWLAARRGRWPLAAGLAAAAGVVRPDGVWLTVALVVMALTGPAGRRLRSAAVMSCGLAGPAAYELYLRAETGSWLAWARAQQGGWDMHLVTPWSAWRTTWWAAFEHPLGAGYAFEFQAEMAALVVMLVAALWFAVARRWPEAVLCGLAVVAVGTQTWYQGVLRTLLVLFPVAVAVAWWPRWARWAWLSAGVPLAVVFGLLFLAGRWAG